MNRYILILATILGGCATIQSPTPPATQPATVPPLRLGNFSVSLAVKDLSVSRAFYEKIGFHGIAGDGVHYLILQNDTATIGIFQGMFDKNTLTFNPGWDRNATTLPDYDDVRDIQSTLIARGVTPAVKADQTTTGPTSLLLFDPDGNPILIDQHVPSPKQ
jgi:hypothetical protein